MADLVITPANIIAGGGAFIEHGRAGATITAGQTLYKDATDGKMKVGDSDGATALKNIKGIALNGAADGQPLAYIKSGDLNMGAILTAGTAYYASETAGGIQPAADVASEDVIFLGIAKSTSVLTLDIQIPGVTVGP